MTGISSLGEVGISAMPLVRAKLRPPAPVAHYVRRTRLLDLVDEAVVRPLTLVVAPAGAGKTSLVAGWAAESTQPTAWLSLDDRDRDSAQVWRGVIAALDTVAPSCGERALTALRGPESLTHAVAILLDDLADQPFSRSVLVLDDLHVVGDDDVIAESLAMFVAHLPDWLRIVATSRRDLPLPVDRLRARGQLCEIRFTELRFSRDEAGELLSRLAPTLPDDQVDVVVQLADGWAASLQLAALRARSTAAVDRRAVPTPDDGHLVHDYVLHEVLDAEDRDLVEAMGDLAVVDQVNPSLARALTGRPDGGDLLRRAEERGLFVTRLPAPGWYEIHALVRTALVSEVRDTDPERLAELYRRAARWYEEYDEPVQALDHWLLAGRPRDALRLLAARHADLYDGGREATIRRVIEAIPDAVATADLTAMLEFAWCLVLVDRHRFNELVDQLEWWANRPDTPEPVPPRVMMLRAIAATVSGRWVEGGALARQAIADLGEAWWRDPLGRFGWNMVARDVALSERWIDGSEEVREAEFALGRDPERRLSMEATRALGEALAGRPIDALRVAAGVRSAAVVANMTIMRVEVEVEVAEALAHREMGDRARALDVLEALAAVPASTMLFGQVLAMCELVHAYLDGGDVERARQELARVEDVVDREGFGGAGRGWVARAGVLVALAEGDTVGAGRWATDIEDTFWGPASVARVALAAGDRQQAMAELRAALPRCGRHRVTLALLLARAADQPAEADRQVAAAIEEAVELGLLQTVASEGAELLPLVERTAWRASKQWMDRLRRAAAPSGPAVGATGDLAALTSRERDVLRLLAGRLTVREIAGELYISPNTLKFHLKTIYRKLGVASRAEAADVARRMATIPSGPDLRPVRDG